MAIHKTESKTAENGMHYEVLEECGTIATKGTKELKLRYMAWNGNEPKYYLNWWYDKNGEEKCNSGISLTGEELESLYNVLKGMIEE